MKSKRILVILALAIVITTLFSGCIREDPTAAVGEKYDLTKDKNVEIVLKFNKGESFDSVGDNAKYLHDFWSVYLSKFSDTQSDTIWSIIESRKAALEGRDINAVVVVWGYPDNFNMTLVTEEGNFNYVEKQKLPQPDGFTIMGVGSSFNIQNETCIGDSFQYFLASRLWYDNPSLREEVHPSYTIEEGSIVVCITIVAAVVSVVMTIKDGWDIGKVGKSILETRVHNFENMVKAAETGEIATIKKVDIWMDPFGTPHSIITDEEDNKWDEKGKQIQGNPTYDLKSRTAVDQGICDVQGYGTGNYHSLTVKIYSKHKDKYYLSLDGAYFIPSDPHDQRMGTCMVSYSPPHTKLRINATDYHNWKTFKVESFCLDASGGVPKLNESYYLSKNDTTCLNPYLDDVIYEYWYSQAYEGGNYSHGTAQGAVWYCTEDYKYWSSLSKGEQALIKDATGVNDPKNNLTWPEKMVMGICLLAVACLFRRVI